MREWLPSRITLAWAFGIVAFVTVARWMSGVESASFEGQVLWLLSMIASSSIVIMLRPR